MTLPLTETGYRDYEAVKASYPILVVKKQSKRIDMDVVHWLMKLGDAYVVIDAYLEGQQVNFSPWTITYGFKHASDATAFSLRF